MAILSTRVSAFLDGVRVLGLFLLMLLFITPTGQRPRAADKEDAYTHLRERMVARQIQGRGIQDPHVLNAMKVVPRHLFVPFQYRPYAYEDHPLPIGKGQTISQPYIVAFMTAALHLKPKDRILEIGTGSGYQAAVLAEIGCEVYSVEIVPSLGAKAGATLSRLGYKNVHIRIGDGHKGWPEEAPFDAVIVTCAPEEVPPALIQQLNEGGRLIIPVGESGGIQQLVLAVKKGGRLVSRSVLPVRFVPMVKGSP